MRSILEKWLPVQTKIFDNVSDSLRKMVFKDGLELLVLNGGCLFWKRGFETLQQCMINMGEESFVVIENKFDNRWDKEPSFNMKFPCSISWDELMGGDFISYILLDGLMKEFMVYGQSDKWGRYSACNFRSPVDVVGFRPVYRGLFCDNLNDLLEPLDRIEKYLPIEYKNRLALI